MVNKLYVLVASDLTKGQQAAQACHAVAAWMMFDECKKIWPNETIVILQTDKMSDWWRQMDDISESWIDVFEPDLNDKLTAIACWGPKLPQTLKELSLM